MKLELRFLFVFLVAIALAVPVSLALQHRSNLLRIEKSTNSNLRLELNSKQKDLEQKNQQIQQEKQKQDDLQKQLQTKREAQANLAAKAQPAPFVFNEGNCSAYSGLVAQYDWDTHIALAVMHAESGCNTASISRTCDHGLMQINCVHGDMVNGDLSKLHDPATNLRVAYALYKANGWRPWTAYTSGAYLRYL